MNRGFTKGLIVGGIVGMSFGMFGERNGLGYRGRKKIYRAGKKMVMNSGNLLGEVIDMFK